jgi:hypothetical protein
VGGYFDGDGNVGIEVVKYVLRFKLRFSDTWKPQIEAVMWFMKRNGILTTALWHEKSEGRLMAHRIDIGAVPSVLAAGKSMLPHCVKKAEDLRIMIDYLEGRTTGNQAIERINEEVRVGRRSGFIRELNLPYDRKGGLRTAQLGNARKARATYTVNVSQAVQKRIREDHRNLKLGHIGLSRKYGYSVHITRRVLGSS